MMDKKVGDKLKINENIYMLKLPVILSGTETFLYPTIIKDQLNTVLIDTGLEGRNHLENIIEQFTDNGILYSNLDTIILTHQDFDHIGGLHGILESFEKSVEVYFHEAEKSYIIGDTELIKSKGKTMPSLIKLLIKKLHIDKAEEKTDHSDIKVMRLLHHGDVLDFAGGIDVIHTPGHTPGNICLYHSHSKTLIAGDTLNITDGKLTGANPLFTPNMGQATRSIERLTDYDIEKIICYHGGLFEVDCNKAIKDLINTKP